MIRPGAGPDPGRDYAVVPGSMARGEWHVLGPAVAITVRFDGTGRLAHEVAAWLAGREHAAPVFHDPPRPADLPGSMTELFGRVLSLDARVRALEEIAGEAG